MAIYVHLLVENAHHINSAIDRAIENHMQTGLILSSKESSSQYGVNEPTNRLVQRMQ